MGKTWVISLGGSQLAPEGETNINFIDKFKKIILSNSKDKFIIVTGGGSTARKYIKILKGLKKPLKEQSLEGIKVTRMHAIFLARILGKSANSTLPKSMKKVEALLEKNKIVVCGALRYKPKNTSDGTAADLAAHLKCPFINITNVKGLYTSNPKKNKSARFIKNITWKDFNKRAQIIKYSAGQHFVLDQAAAKTILQHKVPTYIIGDLNDLKSILSKKNFKGTLIRG